MRLLDNGAHHGIGGRAHGVYRRGAGSQVRLKDRNREDHVIDPQAIFQRLELAGDRSCTVCISLVACVPHPLDRREARLRRDRRRAY